MSTATIRTRFGAVEGEDFATAVLGPVAEGRPGTAVPVESPVGEPAEPATDTIEDRVRRGALLLDATTPGWATKINGDRLAMYECRRCVLGQVFDHYVSGCRAIGLALPDEKEGDFDARSAAHGFTITGEEIYRSRCVYSALADAWRIEIWSRRPEGRG
jgi:hypothetical protein